MGNPSCLTNGIKNAIKDWMCVTHSIKKLFSKLMHIDRFKSSFQFRLTFIFLVKIPTSLCMFVCHNVYSPFWTIWKHLSHPSKVRRDHKRVKTWRLRRFSQIRKRLISSLSQDFFLSVCDTEVPSVLYLHMPKVSSGLIVVFKIYDSIQKDLVQ